MDDNTALAGIAIVCTTAIYTVHQLCNPSTDGVILAATSTAIFSIFSYLLGHSHGAATCVQPAAAAPIPPDEVKP